MRPEAPPVAKAETNGGPPRSSWAPVDLGPILAGEHRVEPPSLLPRTDGEALFYHRKLHNLMSEPEGCKGWVTLYAAAEVLEAGGCTAMVDFEVEAADAVERLHALGADDKAIRERFFYVRPDEALTDTGWLALEPVISKPLALVILDGVTEAMTLDALNPLDNADVAKWLMLPRRLMQRTGAAVVLVDHVTKDKENRGRYAIGAQHKLAGVDVAYSLKVIEPFGRGMVGEVAVNVKKDRPGYVRHLADGEQVATVRLISEVDGAVSVRVEPPAAQGEFRPTVLMERISEAIEVEPGIGKRDLRRAVKGKHEAKDLALRLLVAEGFVKVERQGLAHLHTNVDLYQASTDPKALDV